MAVFKLINACITNTQPDFELVSATTPLRYMSNVSPPHLFAPILQVFKLQLQHHTFVHATKQDTLLQSSPPILFPNNSATWPSKAAIKAPEGL